jgi:hypothetical protein
LQSSHNPACTFISYLFLVLDLTPKTLF